jgi:hypothetical protein
MNDDVGIPIVFNLAPNTLLDRMMVRAAFYNLQLTTEGVANTNDINLSVEVKSTTATGKYTIGDAAFANLGDTN